MVKRKKLSLFSSDVARGTGRYSVVHSEKKKGGVDKKAMTNAGLERPEPV